MQACRGLRAGDLGHSGLGTGRPVPGRPGLPPAAVRVRIAARPVQIVLQAIQIALQAVQDPAQRAGIGRPGPARRSRPGGEAGIGTIPGRPLVSTRISTALAWHPDIQARVRILAGSRVPPRLRLRWEACHPPSFVGSFAHASRCAANMTGKDSAPRADVPVLFAP